MSEDQSRDFSRFDIMSTEELEEILRLDAEAPEGTESDTELMLYILEVLAQRKNLNITGNTAQKAWHDFETYYMPDQGSSCAQKCRTWLRRFAAVAAALVLLISIPLAADALGWDELWESVAAWAKETFSFVSGDDPVPTEPEKQDVEEYRSLQEALEATDQDFDNIPTYIPDRYVLEDITIYENPIRRLYNAIYKNGEKELIITVSSYHDKDPEKVEINQELIEVYRVAGWECYIFSNNEQLRAVWLAEGCECYVSGELTIEEMKMMLDSIGKG